jgi:hypothetical protein
MHLLAFDPQRLPARGQDVHLRRGVENRGSQRSGCRDDVLAIVEDQQHPLVPQIREECGHWIVGLGWQTEHQQDRGDDEIGIAERGQIHKVRGVGERLEQIVSNPHRNGGLADAAGADDRDEA